MQATTNHMQLLRFYLALIIFSILAACSEQSSSSQNQVPQLRNAKAKTLSLTQMTTEQAQKCLTNILPKTKFDELYPTTYASNIADSPATIRKTANNYYSYENLEKTFIDLYVTKGYPAPFCSGNKLNDTRELAAILANISQETNGWSPPRFDEQGLLYLANAKDATKDGGAGKMGIPYGILTITEGDCKNNPSFCAQYGSNFGFCQSTDTAANLAASCGKDLTQDSLATMQGYCKDMLSYCLELAKISTTTKVYYYGRGAKQLSYAYNYVFYGSKISPNDPLFLARNPDLVNNNGVLGWETGLVYWSLPFAEGNGTLKPSMHDGMFQVTTVRISTDNNGQELNPLKEFNDQIGFGKTINLINGGVECGKTRPTVRIESLSRINYFLELMMRLNPSEIKSVSVIHTNGDTDTYGADDLSYNLNHNTEKKFSRNNKVITVDYTSAYPSYVRYIIDQNHPPRWSGDKGINNEYYNSFVLDQNYYYAPANNLTKIKSISVTYSDDSTERLDCANVQNYEGK